MARVYLIEGPVGSGKSTFSRILSQKNSAPHINLDSWMARLFSPDRPVSGTIEWYVERKERCVEQIWNVTKVILDLNCDVILELGLVQRINRYAMYTRIKESGHQLYVYVLDAPREIRRERVQSRNTEKGDTFSMVVPDDIFEIASDMWERPDEIECSDFEIEFVVE